MDARSTYESLRDALIRESGAPDDTIETPDATNDSLRTGGASLFLVWGGPRHKSQSTMRLTATVSNAIAIAGYSGASRPKLIAAAFSFCCTSCVAR